MSHDHTPATGTPGKSLLSVGKELISPRENVKASSVVENIAEVARGTGSLAAKALATTVDIPLGMTEMAIAAANNVVGSATNIVDQAVVQPINWTRAAIKKTITHPFGSAEHAHAA